MEQRAGSRHGLSALGFTIERSYGDRVERWHRWVDDRIELVAFVAKDGSIPNRVQVWIDGLPQDMERLIADRAAA